jgi:hypothetical protein
MASSNRWLRTSGVALVSARRQALSARKLAYASVPRRATEQLSAAAGTMACGPIHLNRHPEVKPYGVCTLVGVGQRPCAIHRVSPGSRQ